MLCKICNIVMGTGTRYEQQKGRNQLSYRRYYECKDRVYTNSPNFQETLARGTKKSRSK